MPHPYDNEHLEAAAQTASSMSLRYRTDYSGRAMYGATCFAIVGNMESLAWFYRDLPIHTFQLLVGNGRSDAMGLDTVYYWPVLRTGGE